MTQHIEHAWKVALKRAVADRDGEDGYSIVVDYMGSLSPKDRKYRDSEIKRSSRNPYAHGVYEKYADCMPVWAFLELTSFGTLADFVRFCGNRWGDKSLVRAHYDLKKVKSVRNCAAHGSCIINVFAEGENSRHTTSVDTLERAVAECKHNAPGAFAESHRGVICFYLNADDLSSHRRILAFMLGNKLIRKTKAGKLYNIGFKLDDQTRAGEYGSGFSAEIKLKDFVDLETGVFL